MKKVELSKALTIPVVPRGLIFERSNTVLAYLNHICGCENEVEITVGVNTGNIYIDSASYDRMRRYLIPHIGTECNYCVAKRFDTSSLPSLCGSEKQIEWANSLRVKHLTEYPSSRLGQLIDEASVWIDFRYKKSMKELETASDEQIISINEDKKATRLQRENSKS